ncbi:MAG: DUF4340 domain-containing protein [Pseudomonadota bacterium]
MKAKILVALAGVTAVAAVAAIAVSRDGGPVGPAAGERLFPELAARGEDIRMLSIARLEGAFTLVRGEQGWVMPEKSNYPASLDKVRKFLFEFAELRTMEAKTSVASNYAALEVEDLAGEAKSVLVSLKDGDGKEVASLIVGKQRFGRGGGAAAEGVYVRKAGEAQAWLARGRLSVDRDSVRWLDRKLADISRDRVRRVEVLAADGARLTLERAKADVKDFAIRDLPEGRKPKSPYDVNAVGGAFEALELEDVRPAAELEFAAERPGAELTSFDGLKLRASLADKDGETWVRFGASFEAPAEPLKLEDGGKLKPAEEVAKEVQDINARLGAWAYKLATWKLDAMRKKLADLLEEKA